MPKTLTVSPSGDERAVSRGWSARRDPPRPERLRSDVVRLLDRGTTAPQAAAALERDATMARGASTRSGPSGRRRRPRHRRPVGGPGARPRTGPRRPGCWTRRRRKGGPGRRPVRSSDCRPNGDFRCRRPGRSSCRTGTVITVVRAPPVHGQAGQSLGTRGQGVHRPAGRTRPGRGGVVPPAPAPPRLDDIEPVRRQAKHEDRPRPAPKPSARPPTGPRPRDATGFGHQRRTSPRPFRPG